MSSEWKEYRVRAHYKDKDGGYRDIATIVETEDLDKAKLEFEEAYPVYQCGRPSFLTLEERTVTKWETKREAEFKLVSKQSD